MSWRLAFFILALICLSPTKTGSDFSLRNFFVVWNVGQGQWATLKLSDDCHHFDMGGERSPGPEVAKLCGAERNFIYLSHWDLDHISFVEKSSRWLARRCLALPPLGTSNARKMRGVQSVPACGSSKDTGISWSELTHLSLTPEARGRKPISSNDLSHVLLVDHQFLIPGDSGRAPEKMWSTEPGISSTRLLLLGHHGSRTSTSPELLQRLPHLKVAISSARYRRYGHPHAEVVAELRYFHVPLLRTEDWGNLWFELPRK